MSGEHPVPSTFSASDAQRGVPFFSICIPQYNRTSFLMETCRSLAQQTFSDFEVCISDDRSTDGRQQELRALLGDLGLRFTYYEQPVNRRYDGNLRQAIALSTGTYCFLMGNDDALKSPTVLEEVREDILRNGDVGVVISNYEDFSSGEVTQRVKQTGVVGTGPDVAVENFRNFSFVSGVALHGPTARALATERWDGSEMYQMYVGSRIIASGMRLLAIDRPIIRKDIQIVGEAVDSYARKPRLDPCPIVERRLNLDAINRLVADAITPYVAPGTRERYVLRIALQTVLFTYPYWLFEYRRVQSWRYALGICLGMRPRILLAGLGLGWPRSLLLTGLYAAVSLAGLLLPTGIFQALYQPLHDLAKRGRTFGNRAPARSLNAI